MEKESHLVHYNYFNKMGNFTVNGDVFEPEYCKYRISFPFATSLKVATPAAGTDGGTGNELDDGAAAMDSDAVTLNITEGGDTNS